MDIGCSTIVRLLRHLIRQISSTVTSRNCSATIQVGLSQWRIQDFLTEGSELSGGPRYPVSKTEYSSDLVHYFWGGVPN